MAIRNIDHFIDTTEHHIGQLITIAAEIEGAREVPGIMYAVYYLTRAKEAAEEIKEKRDKDAEKDSTKTKPSKGNKRTKVGDSK